MAERTSMAQALQKGYIAMADILTELNTLGIEQPRMGDPLPAEDSYRCLWQLVKALECWMALGVYKESDTTFRVRGGSFVVDGAVVTYAQEAAVDPTDNDTTYIWMEPDGDLGYGVDGDGWPVEAHIKLAEIDVDADGVITAIRDLRGTAFLRFETGA